MPVSVDACKQITVGTHADCVDWKLTFATSLDANQSNLLIRYKVIERSNGVAATTDTGHNNVW
jgi:hypothetical protein